MKSGFIFFMVMALVQAPALGTNDGDRTLDFSFDADIPVVRASDDFSSFTAGLAWSLAAGLSDRPLRRQDYSYGTWASDHRFALETTGMLLLDEKLNNRPLEADLFWAVGFDLVRRFIEPEDEFDLEEPEQTDMGWLNFLYGYRFAFHLNVGIETIQTVDSGWIRFGPGLRLLHRHQYGWKMLLPNLHFYYEGLHELGDGLVTSPGIDCPETYSRFRLIQRHQINFGFAGLENLLLAAGYQYTHDFGVPQVFKDDGLHNRFGFTGDLSYILGFSGSDNLIRSAGVFIRFTSGELAPFVETDRAFMAGIRF